jgi:hypothetical protein
MVTAGPEASIRAGADLQVAAEHLDPFAHADQAVTGACPAVADRGHRAAAVVGHLDPDVLVTVADHDLGAGRAGVLDHVGQGLLHDPVGGQVDPGGQRRRRPLHLQPHSQAGLGHLG